MHTSRQATESSALFIATIVSVGSVAVNAAIPGAIDIEAAFALESGAGARLIGTFVAGYAVGHVLVGALAQQVSHKALLLAGLAGFIACSVLIAVASEPALIGWGRALQGVFSSTCPIIGRVLVRQMGTSRRSAQRMSGAYSIFTWVPVLAPLFAGVVSQTYGWRFVYLALATYAGAGLLWVLVTPSGQFAEHAAAIKAPTRYRATAQLLAAPVSRAALISGSLAFAGYFSFLAVAPSIYSRFDVATIPLHGAITVFTGCYALGAIVSRIALNYVSEVSVLVLSLASMVIIATIQAGLVIRFGPQGNTIALACVYAIPVGAVMPNANLLAMRPSVACAPVAVACFGMSKMGLVALITWWLTSSGESGVAHMTLVMWVAAVSALLATLPLRGQAQESHHRSHSRDTS